MIYSKVDPEISEGYENNLSDKKLKTVGHKLRSEFDVIISLKRGVLERCIEGGLDISSVDLKDENAIFNINNLVWRFLMDKEEEYIQQNLKKSFTR